MASSSSVPSNSFLLTTTPHSRLLLSNKPRQLTVFAKNSGPFSSFRFRKSSDDDSSSEDEAQVKTNKPFQFNWGNVKISDVDVKSLIPAVSNFSGLQGPGRQKDAGTVFVAGATGQAGARISQQLLREGFKVRAGVPDLGAAQELARFASEYKIISKDELKRLNAVESMFNDAESIAKAIGNASKVVVTIGSSENGPNKEVSVSDALQVVEAAQLAGVGHMAIICDESPVASTNNVLDGISSFFNNLFSQSQSLTVTEFLERVIQTDVKYTFIRTALTEDFSPESSYKVVVAAEGSAGTNDFKVARSQMAALVAGLFSNTEVAEDKVVDVYTDPSAPLKALEELFSVIPEDRRRQEYLEAIARAKAEEEAIKAAEQAREAEDAKQKLEEEVKKLAEQEARAASLAEDAKQKADKAGASLDSLLTKAKDLSSGGQLSWDKLGSQLSDAVKATNIELPKVQVATVRGQAKARNSPAQKAVTNQTTPKQKSRTKVKPEPKEEKPKGKEAKTEVRNILGGLFKQETIYVDDA
ncbi:Protein PLASTID TRANSCRIPTIONALLY ACTIVE 16 chloroplastic [Bienertia sinuspersici]